MANKAKDPPGFVPFYPSRPRPGSHEHLVELLLEGEDCQPWIDRLRWLLDFEHWKEARSRTGSTEKERARMV